MATFKYPQIISRAESAAFDQITEAGHTAPHSGVYRCEGCGHEAVSTQGNRLPPQNHHQHTWAQGHIRWRLIVASAHS